MSFQFQNYGQERDLICTEQEREIHDRICSVLNDAGIDTSVMCLVRKSDNYVSSCMASSSDYGDMDVARIKFTNRAKWIKLCPEFVQIKIEAPEDVLEHREELIAAYRFNEPYL